MPERKHDEVDDDRESDDRPAIVPDVAVNPVERAKQRHDDDGEHPEIDRANQIAVDARQDIEILRADVEPHGLIAAARLDVVGDQITRRVLRPGRRRDAQGLKRDGRLSGREGRRHEVVIVDARVLKIALVRRLLDDVRGGEALHVVRNGEEPARFDGAASRGQVDVAESRTPLNHRSQAQIVLRDRRAKCDQVGRRFDAELLDGAQSAAVPIFERQLRRRRHGSGVRRRAGDRVERAVERLRLGLARHAQREGKRLLLAELVRDELDRLAFLVLIMLEPPALQPRTAVREDRDHVARFNAHVAFARIADERLGRRRGGRLRFGSSGRQRRLP